jgi:chromosomal replication initiator protein
MSFSSVPSAELVPPDFNTKKDILLNKVKAEGLLIPEDVVDYIAGAVTDNVRELEGVVSSLLAQSILINAEINLDLAQKVVGKIANTTSKVVNISKIQEVVCDYYNLEVNDIQTKSRKRVVVQARQEIMYKYGMTLIIPLSVGLFMKKAENIFSDLHVQQTVY